MCATTNMRAAAQIETSRQAMWSHAGCVPAWLSSDEQDSARQWRRASTAHQVALIRLEAAWNAQPEEPT